MSTSSTKFKEVFTHVIPEKIGRKGVVKLNTKTSNGLCKKCKLRSRANGSCRCKQCSYEYNAKKL